MTRRIHDRPHEASARDAAAAWHVRLGADDANEADWLAFEAWLAQSPAHGRAYDAVEALWAELDGMAPPPAPVVAFRPRRRALAGSGWGMAIAAALVGAVALGLGLRDPVKTTVYATAKGEQRLVSLADGTRIRLNSGSRLTVRLGRRERRVEMADAEALFEVAHDPARPFVVRAGDREIRDVGTVFDVLRHAGRVDVAVRSGVVEVRPSGAGAGVRLVRGEGLSHHEGGPGVDSVRAVDPESALAWTQGRLVYRDRPLAEVAADLDRYLPTPIVVAPEARDLRLTAALRLDSEDAMLGRLAAFLPVRAIRENGRIHLVSSSARR